MKKTRNTLWIAMLGLLWLPSVASAQVRVPQKINIQAIVRDGAGQLVNMSYTSAEVSLWTDVVGGESVWSDEMDIAIQKGVANLVLEIASNVFAENQSLWFEIALTDDLVVARRQFVSAPYAHFAENCARLDNKLPGHYMPQGGIIMWSGSIASIPDGWALCNGSNNTPDLRDRFIVGAGSEYAVHATGGESTVTLTEAQMPTHTHGPGTYKGRTWGSTSEGSTRNIVRITSGTFTHYAQQTAEIEEGVSGGTGGGQSHENKPPYYGLAYIMKL